jgi:HOOK domain
MLKEFDSNYFDIHVVEGKPFMSRYKALKSVVDRAEVYMTETGSMNNSVAVDSPNLVKIASQADSTEIVKLLKILIVIAVTCAKHEVFIGRIQRLDAALQTHLMHIIGPALDVEPQEETQESRELALEEQLAKVLAERNELLEIQARLESSVQELTEDVGKHQLRVEELERMDSGESSNNVVDEYKDYIVELETKLDRANAQLRDNQTTIKQMSETIEGNGEVLKETEDLQKQLAENDQELSRLYKIESVAKKYKARLQEQKDLERRMESLENQNFELKNTNRLSMMGSTLSIDEMSESQQLHEGERALSEELKRSGEPDDRADEAHNRNVDSSLALPSERAVQSETPPSTDAQSIDDLQRQIKDLELELELVTSAWYALGSRIQQQNVIVMKKTYESPKGWITKQRLVMDKIP